jgi:hypothetical protein
MIYIIYKISIGDECYIGSTKDLAQRKAHHKHSCNNESSNKYHYKLYKYIRDNGGFDKCDIIPVEEYECETKRAAECREEYWRRKYKATLNMKQAFTTEEESQQKLKEWREANKDHIREMNKIWEQNNLELIHTQHMCECGGTYVYKHKARHLKTTLHQNYINEKQVEATQTLDKENQEASVEV